MTSAGRAVLHAATAALLAAGLAVGLAPPVPEAVSPAPVSAPPETRGPDAAAAVPAADEVAAAVAPALADAPGRTSVQVRDAVTGTVLHQRDADRPVAPASSLKILTAATVLRTLGADRTLDTRVVAVPGGPGRATELVLDGGGDVLLGTGESDAARVDGRGGLRTLARDAVAGLTAAGVTGDVVVSTDLRLFEDDDGLNPAWTPDLPADGHISAVQPLATYGGRETPGTGEERIPDPAQFAALTFQAHLADAVAASGADLRVGLREEIPAARAARDAVLTADPVARTVSAPVGEQVAHLLAHSENQVSEALAHVAAHVAGRPATHSGAAALLTETAARLGLDTEGLRLQDASGLSAGNRMTAGQLAALVAALTRDPGLAPVLEGLPGPGEDSTLGERFEGTAAAGAVAAKTGTLDHTVSLTGTVRTGSGRVLAFSMIGSELDWRLADARRAVDAAVTALAELP